MEVDVNTFARFKRHLLEEDSVENRNEVERYLIDGCEDPNNDKLDILGCERLILQNIRYFRKLHNMFWLFLYPQ
jgi:hypothetical protein